MPNTEETAEMPPLANPGLIGMLPTLSGTNCREFFEGLDVTKRLAGWNDQQAISIATLKMEGPARAFYENSLKGITFETLKSFREAFLDHFREHKTLARAIAEFNTAAQLPHEEVKDFASRLEGLVHTTIALKFEGSDRIPKDFQEQMLLSQFISGLKPNLKAQVMVADPKTLEAAKLHAKRVEESQKVLSTSINSVQGHTGESAQSEEFAKVLQTTTETYAKSLELVTAQLRKMEARLDKLTAAPQQRLQPKPPVTCHYCGIRGHFVRDCRKRMREQQGNEQRQTQSSHRQNSRFPPNM